MPFQVAVHGPQVPSRTVPLRVGVNVVGRGGRADIHIQGPLVSRTHAKLVLEADGKVQLYDLDSHNGVFVNGEKVRSRVVSAGENIYVGGFRLTLESVDGDGAAVVGDSLRAMPIPEATLKAVDAARHGDDVAFQGKDPTARNLAVLARAVELLSAGNGTQQAVEALINLAREMLRASHVALLKQAPGNMLALAAQSGSLPGEPPLCWPVIKRAADDKSAFVSRDKPAEAETVPGNPLGAPAALLVLPLVADEGARVAGVLQVLRPHKDTGYLDQEVDLAIVVGRLLAVQLAGPVREGGSAPAAMVHDDPTETARQPLDVGVQGGMGRDEVRAALLKAVPEELADRVLALAGGQVELPSQYAASEQVAVYYELQGFEQFARGRDAAVLAKVVGALAGAAGAVAGAFGGRLDQCLGAGGIMRFWDGTPAEAAEAALRALMELRARLPAAAPEVAGMLSLRAGVDVGPVLAGVFGDAGRATYTIVGAPVRVAERIAEMAGNAEIYITAPVRALLAERGWRLIALGPHALRGRPEAVDLFRVDGAPAGAA